MNVRIDTSTVKNTRWFELAVRFCLGGLITAATGIIGKKLGPAVGGLFLAFPAIFPASATLIEKHQIEKKQEAGLSGVNRARQLVAVDAAGTAIGCIGLFAFAWLVSSLITSHPAWLVICAGTLLWMIVAVVCWYIRKRI